MLKPLVKLSTVALLMRICGAVIIALNLAIITRSLSADEVGTFALLSGLIFVGRYLGPIGYDQLLFREIGSSNNDLGGFEYIEKMALLRVSVVTLCGVVIALILTVFVFNLMVGERNWFLFVTGTFIYAASALSGTFVGALRGRGKLLLALVGDGFLPPAFSLFVIASAYYFDSLSQEVAWVALAFGSGVGAIVQWCALMRLWSGVGDCRPAVLGSRQAMHLWMVQALNFLQGRFGIYVAAYGGLQSVTITEIAARIALISSLATWAIGMVISPQLANFKNAPQTATKCLAFGMIAGFATSFSVFLMFVAVGERSIGFLFGDEYKIAYWPAFIMLAAFIVNGTLGIFATFLIMNRHENIVLLLNTASLCVGVGLAFILASIVAMPISVALGTFLATVVRDGGAFLYMNRRYSVFRDSMAKAC